MIFLNKDTASILYDSKDDKFKTSNYIYDDKKKIFEVIIIKILLKIV